MRSGHPQTRKVSVGGKVILEEANNLGFVPFRIIGIEGREK